MIRNKEGADMNRNEEGADMTRNKANLGCHISTILLRWVMCDYSF